MEPKREKRQNIQKKLGLLTPVVAAVPSISPTPRPYLSRFPRLVLNRSVSRIWRTSVSVTVSNRRLRTRTHGGVAGASGQPLPLCRSNAVTGKVVLRIGCWLPILP